MKRIFYMLLSLLCFSLTACTVYDESEQQPQHQGANSSAPWQGRFAIELTGNGTQPLTTTLLVTGSEITFGQLPGASGPVVTIYLHTGSSGSTEYFDLTQKENATAPKWVAVYQKKTGLWSGVVTLNGASYPFTATKRIL